MNSIEITARRFIIISGKYLPFIVVAIVTLSNAEAIYAILFERYAEHQDVIVLYKPISWFIGDYFKLSIAWICILTILSIGIEACIWNRVSIAYLALALWQRDYFIEQYIDEITIMVVLVANTIIGTLLVCKGIKILIRHE